jgi:hypothetical protein
VTTFAGLCATCIHARIIENRRGSVFWLCSLSRVDPRFPRYPPLPVRSCTGHEPGEPQGAGEDQQEGQA